MEESLPPKLVLTKEQQLRHDSPRRISRQILEEQEKREKAVAKLKEEALAERERIVRLHNLNVKRQKIDQEVAILDGAEHTASVPHEMSCNLVAVRKVAASAQESQIDDIPEEAPKRKATVSTTVVPSVDKTATTSTSEQPQVVVPAPQTLAIEAAPALIPNQLNQLAILHIARCDDPQPSGSRTPAPDSDSDSIVIDTEPRREKDKKDEESINFSRLTVSKSLSVTVSSSESPPEKST